MRNGKAPREQSELELVGGRGQTVQSPLCFNVAFTCFPEVVYFNCRLSDFPPWKYPMPDEKSSRSDYI